MSKLKFKTIQYWFGCLAIFVPLSIVDGINENVRITIVEIMMTQRVLIESSIVDDFQVVLFSVELILMFQS